MAISNETIRAIVHDYHGFELTDEELDIIRPDLDMYIAELERLRDLELSDVMSSRLLRAREGDDA